MMTASTDNGLLGTGSQCTYLPEERLAAEGARLLYVVQRSTARVCRLDFDPPSGRHHLSQRHYALLPCVELSSHPCHTNAHTYRHTIRLVHRHRCRRCCSTIHPSIHSFVRSIV